MTRTFTQAETAGREIYREDRTGNYWVFYRIGDKVGSWYFPPFAGQDAAAMTVGFYEGMREAEKRINHKTIFWLTPEQFVEAGGQFKA